MCALDAAEKKQLYSETAEEVETKGVGVQRLHECPLSTSVT